MDFGENVSYINEWPPLEVLASDLTGDVRYPSRAIGVELEVENCKPFAPDTLGWIYHDEPSLRGGSEFVTEPILAKHFPALFEAFLAEIADKRKDYSCGPRTSTHVHVNVRDLTPRALSSVFLAYYSLEKSLFRFVGEGRKDNPYCVPWNESDMGYFFHAKNWNLGYISSDKYAALNWMNAAPGGRGTLEFRHLHGMNRPEKVLIWVGIVSTLVDNAAKIDPDTLMAMFSRLRCHSDILSYLNLILGDWAGYVAPGAHSDVQDSIRDIVCMSVSTHENIREAHPLTSKLQAFNMRKIALRRKR